MFQSIKIIDQTEAILDQKEYSGELPEYSGLLHKTGDKQITMVSITSRSIMFLDALTGRGESFTGEAMKVAFDAYSKLILGNKNWVDLTANAQASYRIFLWQPDGA